MGGAPSSALGHPTPVNAALVEPTKWTDDIRRLWTLEWYKPMDLGIRYKRPISSTVFCTLLEELISP
ncbi:jg18133 [Pararge aegeria aegeria]|uniref:Jg18133 protein n=1 Tax=Pararge aegeria aegeria TaxID=348720 RepID=A0A8S4S216_9NEOP|nr:jg18133 [Pararge aegeria aegeria]